ncbi:Disease resistance protein RGA2 [Rhynchospora pubera]|uniref:Disease resistance protein RGA2 n=1 Tax=Rhynchospora pubera TaxID=906938 RepID=A0AAV8E2J6_9POAL|nr:Disease resistance protein RGA2 [Rhynchospora pubera]
MAEAGVFAALGWVASPLMKMLFDKAHRLLGNSMDEKMEMLVSTVLPGLSLVIDKAENSPNKTKLGAWLKRLKDAYYDAEEAIDLLEYQLLEQNLKTEDRRTRVSLFSLLVPPCLQNIMLIKKRISLKIELKIHIDKLVQIAKEANEFCNLLEAPPDYASTSNSDRETICQLSGIVFGREKDKEVVARLLREEQQPGLSDRPGVPIIIIMGRSGIGKTTLAQYVYQYMGKQTYFDLLLWVHVPRKFKAADIVKKTLRNIHSKYGALHVDNYDPSGSLDDLAARMSRMLGSKKFLLILDDFWCDAEDEREQWKNFISCFSGWQPAGKIILTTQSVRAAENADLADLTEIKTYHLQQLEKGEFFKLFMHHAWPSNRSMQRVEFKNIGYKIAAKLRGDPGTAKIVGHQLREKLEVSHWERIAEKDWLGDNMKVRIWSYQQLPAHLQRCFAFCGLFLKGVQFPGQFLIQLWIAEGYVKPVDKDNQGSMEEIGERYLNELVCRFFLEQHVLDGNKIIHYQLHDLLHDLAERVQGDDFLKIENYSRNVPPHISQILSRSENIRHIYLPMSMMIVLQDKICLMKNLRTLICYETACTIPKQLLREILKNSKKLRVLCLPSCEDDFPDCFGNLKHLRLLHFVGSMPLKKLPASICKLYHLQTLSMQSCESLPKKFCRLISLRHFITEGETMPYISDVGRLMSLQGLKEFTIRKKRGHELHQLENLNQLRGSLCISGLENASLEDAVKANMGSKIHLEELQFGWKSDKSVADEFQLLDALQPHPNIKGLRIVWFTGNKLPNWLLGQKSTLKHLTALHLTFCSNLEDISTIYESIPKCEVLSLTTLSSLKELPLLPQNLTRLSLVLIPQLSYISENDIKMRDERKQFMLEAAMEITKYMKERYPPLLFEPTKGVVRRYLYSVKERSSNCEKLVSKMTEIDPWDDDCPEHQLLDAWEMCMQYHLETILNKNEESKLILPSALTILEIQACSITSDALSNCIEHLVCLSELQLVEIQTITSLPREEVLHTLKNLRSICIEHCYLLSSLGGIRALTSLTELTVKWCHSLNSSNELPSSLERLIFRECAYVDVILDQSDLPKLRVLEVHEALCVQYLREGCRTGVLHVGRLPCLKELTLGGWKGHLKGFNSLTSLYVLMVYSPGNDLASPIHKCTIRIEKVYVDNPLLLKKMLSDLTISSIEFVSIVCFEGESIDDDEVFQSLTSLKTLHLSGCNITHLPMQLKNLASLEYMIINNCPNLCEIESLPKNFSQLDIEECPTLSEKFNNHGSYQVWIDEGTTIVTFPKEGQTMLRPSQPTQQENTSYPPNPQRVLANQHQSSTTAEHRHKGIEAIPHDSLDYITGQPPLHVSTGNVWFKAQFDEAGPSRTAYEEVDADEEEEEIVPDMRRQCLLRHTP